MKLIKMTEDRYTKNLYINADKIISFETTDNVVVYTIDITLPYEQMAIMSFDNIEDRNKALVELIKELQDDN